MKQISITVASVLMLTQVEAHAFEAIANVVGVAPITEQVNHPTQQCWTETQQVTQAVPQQRNYLGAIVGGVAGGLLGSQVGRGNGRVAAPTRTGPTISSPRLRRYSAAARSTIFRP